MNAGSAKECSKCGAAFDAASIVPASRPRVCPQCRAQLPKLIETCACGHVFTDVRALREHLEERVRIGWSLIGLGMAGFVICAALMFATAGKFILLWAGGVLLVARGFIMRRHAKADLADIRNARGELPAAKVIR